MGKIYLIGHNGFIGKRVRNLIPEEKRVFLTREDVRLLTLGEKKINFSFDDVLINLAWEHLDNFRSHLHITNVLTEHICFYNSILKMGLRNLTTIGTCLEYGIAEGELTEELPTNPTLPYAIAKDCLRRYLEYKRVEGKFNFNWIRLFYIYGEGQSRRTIYGQLVEAIEKNQKVFDMSLGKQKRDYLHVEKVADIILTIALGNEMHGLINCCSGKPITMIDFVNERLKELGSDIKLNLGKYPYPDYEAFEFWGSVEKIRSIIGDEYECN